MTPGLVGAVAYGRSNMAVAYGSNSTTDNSNRIIKTTKDFLTECHLSMLMRSVPNSDKTILSMNPTELIAE